MFIYFVQKLIVVSLVVRFKKKKHPNSNLHVKSIATHEEINNKDIFAHFKLQKVQMVDNGIWLEMLKVCQSQLLSCLTS